MLVFPLSRSALETMRSNPNLPMFSSREVNGSQRVEGTFSVPSAQVLIFTFTPAMHFCEEIKVRLRYK